MLCNLRWFTSVFEACKSSADIIKSLKYTKIKQIQPKQVFNKKKKIQENVRKPVRWVDKNVQQKSANLINGNISLVHNFCMKTKKDSHMLTNTHIQVNT